MWPHNNKEVSEKKSSRTNMERSDYLSRGFKLQQLLLKLAPAPTDEGIDWTFRLIGLANSKGDGQITADFDVDQPIHITLRDMHRNVIEFMNALVYRLPPPEMKHSPPLCDIDVPVLLQAYPILLTQTLKTVVQRPRVEVKAIKGKGKGVVATADICANSIITFYPIDVVRISCNKKQKKKRLFVSTYRRLTDMLQKRGAIDLDDYKYTISDIDIYGEPEMHTAGCCGHMINDGDGPIKDTNNSILVPLFGGAIIAAVAVFDINAGAEILAAYGDNYWKKRCR